MTIRLPNGEYTAPWKCANCSAINKDTISPRYGPWVTCSCTYCGFAFDNSHLDAASVKSLEAAREAAERES